MMKQLVKFHIQPYWEHTPYHDFGETYYHTRDRERAVTRLRRQAARLGFTVMEPPTASPDTGQAITP